MVLKLRFDKAFLKKSTTIITKALANNTYYLVQEVKEKQFKEPHTLLLSIFDVYTITYTDRTELSKHRDIER